MPVRVLGPNGGTQEEIAAGIRYAVDNGARVINMSLGNPLVPIPVVESAIRYATQQGAVVVISSGNEGLTQSGYPGRYASTIPGVISVGAVDRGTPNQLPRVSAFSNRAWNNQINYVVAPGERIFSTMPINSPLGPHNLLDGTSMAAPHVAGVAALMLSANPRLTPAEVVNILTATANPRAVTV